jgi:hypothetical protein
LLLGLLSVFFLLITGLPALILGFRAVRRINEADGRLRGLRLAIAAMILGSLGTLVGAIGIGSIILVQVNYQSQQTLTLNHLRMIGAGLTRYHDMNDRFPAATFSPLAEPPEKRLSWLAELLPYLGGDPPEDQPNRADPMRARFEQLYTNLVPAKSWDDPANANMANLTIRGYLSPGHPTYDPKHKPAPTHFVGIAGLGPEAMNLPRDNAKAGLFGNDRGVTLSQIHTGASYTFAALQTTKDNGPWIAGAYPTVRGVEEGAERYIGTGEAFGGVFVGVGQGLFVDGSARTMKADMRGEVFRAHAVIGAGGIQKKK